MPAEILYDSGCPVCDLEMKRYCRNAALGAIVRLPAVRSLAAGFYDLILAPLIWRWNVRRRASGLVPPAA